MPVCPKCRLDLLNEDFYQCPSRRNNRSTYCINCTKHKNSPNLLPWRSLDGVLNTILPQAQGEYLSDDFVKISVNKNKGQTVYTITLYI